MLARLSSYTEVLEKNLNFSTQRPPSSFMWPPSSSWKWPLGIHICPLLGSSISVCIQSREWALSGAASFLKLPKPLHPGSSLTAWEPPAEVSWTRGKCTSRGHVWPTQMRMATFFFFLLIYKSQYLQESFHSWFSDYWPHKELFTSDNKKSLNMCLLLKNRITNTI